MKTRELLDGIRGEYFAENDREVVRAGEEAWPEIVKLPPSQEIGLICTYVRLAFYRQKRYPEGDLWWERNLEQWRACGYLGGLAILLIAPALKSLAFSKLYAAPEMGGVARMIMKAAGAIAERSGKLEDATVYSGHGLLRHVHENLGYVLFCEGNQSAAVREYTAALECVRSYPDDTFPLQSKRADLQVRGGLALAEFFADQSQNGRERLVQQLEMIEREARGQEQLRDVQEVTLENLRLLNEMARQLDVGDLRHYSVR